MHCRRSHRAGTRKQELRLIKHQENHAKSDQLQNIAENLQENGPDSICDCPPLVSRLPKKRSPEELLRLKQLLRSLPLHTPDPTKMEILIGKGIWMDSGRVLTWKLDYAKEPEKHFRLILRHLLEDILPVPGFSISGRNDTVKVPNHIADTVLAYVFTIYINNGGDRSKVTFSPTCILHNMLNNRLKKNKTDTPCNSSEHTYSATTQENTSDNTGNGIGGMRTDGQGNSDDFNEVVVSEENNNYYDMSHSYARPDTTLQFSQYLSFNT